MAVLTSTGITFSDATVLNSKYGIVPKSRSIIFYQASAPTGWTQVTTHNDKALRIVSGTGAGSGGISGYSVLSSSPFSGTAPVTITGLAVGDTTLSTPQIPSHSHPSTSGNFTNNMANASVGPGSSGQPSLDAVPSTESGSTGGGLAHNHPVSVTSASGPTSGSVNMLVQYIDVIICSFN